MDPLNESTVNVYLPDSYLKGVISFSETNAIGSCLLKRPYLKNDNTAKVAIENPVIEHVRLKNAINSKMKISDYRIVEPVNMQHEIMKNVHSCELTLLKQFLTRSKNISTLKLNMICDWLQLKSTSDDTSILSFIDVEFIPSWVSNWFSNWYNLNKLILEFRKEEVIRTGSILCRSLGKLVFIVSSYGCIVKSNKSKRVSFFTYNQLLTWKDVMLSRFNANFCIWVSNSLNENQEGLGLRSNLQGILTNKLYETVDYMLSLCCNEGFSLVKEFEGFIMSEILRITEHAQFSTRFRNTLLNGLTDQLTKLKNKNRLRVHGTVLENNDYPMYEVVLKLLGDTLRCIKLLINKNLENAAELYYIFRIFGHPMVDERDAMDAVKLNNEITKILRLESLTELRGAFILRIIKGFVDNNKRWPKIKNLKVLSKRWTMYFKAKNYPSQLELSEQDFLELAAIQFEQEFSVPEKTNLEMVLNDKAISPPKRLIWSVYPKNYLPETIKNRYLEETFNASDSLKTRRVLEYYLKDNKFDQKELKSYVVKQEYLNDKDHIVSLTGKERELSVGRMFAMQPGKQRQIQILAEKLLADNIVPFFPETLTKYGDLDLQRIMEIKSELSSIKTRRNDSYNNYIARASIVTDLSKFNQAFRYETTAICADVADELHGTQSLFCWLHLIVPMTTMICAYRHAPPETKGEYDIDKIEEQSGLYRYHMGGIEGWCQKLWTMEAISLLDVVSVKTRCQMTSLLNGDNQSIDVSKPVKLSEGLDEVKADYSLAVKMLKEIRDAYRNIGHKLKEGETYISRDLQFISKVIQSEGVMHPTPIKKILRVGPWINTILDDIKTSAESIGSLCQELEFRGESIIVSLILRNFWLYNLYMHESKQHPLAGKQLFKQLNKTLTSVQRFFEIKKENEVVDLWMNIPMQFGGGDPVVFYRSFYRRTPDFLTEAISHVDILLKISANIRNEAKISFFKALLSIEKNERATLTTLMRDPQAVGSERQAKVTSDINRTAVTSILSLSPNQLFSDSAIHYSRNEEEVGIIADNITPVYPHGLRVLYESLPFHKAEKVVNMISGTKSITNLLQRTSAINGEDIDRAVSMMLENLGLLSRILSVVVDSVEIPTKSNGRLICCQISRTLRETSWNNMEIVGVTSPSITTCMDVIYATSSHLKGIIIEKFSTDRTTRGQRGPKSPWVGSSTQEKKLVPVYNRQILSKQQREQLEAIGKMRWVYKGTPGLRRLLNKICLGSLGISYKCVKPLLPRFMSVNFLHRLSVSSRPMEFPASVPAYRTTNYHFDTSPINQALSERFGNEDINLVFQNAISCGISIMSVVEQLTGRSPKQLVLIPQLEEIDIMPPPVFQGKFNYKLVDKITSDQHIFSPDKIDMLTLGKMLMPTIKGQKTDQFLNKRENYFHGNNLIESLSAALACHWCGILTEQCIENNIFKKDWGDGFISDHAFMDFKIFLCVFKTKLLCSWGSQGKNIKDEDIVDESIDKLLRIDNTFWRMFSKVMFESKVKKRIMLYDVKFLSLVGYIGFKNWFIEQLRSAELHEVPWIVNAEGDLVEIKSIKIYLQLIEQSLFLRITVLNYTDMAHALTRLIRKKLMCDNALLTPIPSPMVNLTQVIDPTEQLAYFPKITFERLKNYDTSSNYAKGKLTRNYMILLPWQHVNRYNFVFSSTGCKVSLKTCIGKLMKDLNPKVLYFIGEGAGNWMARTACEYPDIKFVYRSLKDDLDHHYPLEYQRVIGELSRIIDSGEGLSMETTDATQKTHWDLIHRVSKDALLITLCDAEFKDRDDFFKMVILWRKHVLSCRICTTYGTDLYLFAKYHAKDCNVKLPFFVRSVATFIMQGSKLSGSECYILLTLGHHNNLPCHGEIQNSKMKIAACDDFYAAKKLDNKSVEANCKSLLSGLRIPINKKELNRQRRLLTLQSNHSSVATVGGSKVIESKWLTNKANTIIDWLEHILNSPKGELNYDFFEALENTYPNMIKLIDNLGNAEIKKLIKVTGYMLVSKK
uniref:Replicase n=1 Tax=human metapneumovirus TaxID=162145 RepID=M9V1M7_9MONO|nr:RNA-directed RNA polymerase L [Human metapneumovirus]